jgi:hypothetical protein
MSDAYYPADDTELLTATGQYRDRHGVAWRETFAYKREQERVLTTAESLAYRDACAAKGIRFTEHDGSEDARTCVRASHCAQAGIGYFYCGSTRDDPCGYSADNLSPHAYCTAESCIAGTPEALAQAAGTRAFLLAALQDDERLS